MGKHYKYIFIFLGIIGTVFVARWGVYRLTCTTTENAQVDANIVSVNAVVPGRILEIYVSEGDKVHVDQLIADMEPTEYRLELKRLEAMRDEKKYELERAELSIALKKNGTRPKKQQVEEVRIAEMEAQYLQEQIKKMRSEVERARTALQNTRIVSPVDGIVAKRISMQHEIIPIDKPILIIVDTSSTWITANIAETKIRDIRIGDKARVTVDALPGKSFHGTVKTIGATANSKFSLIPQINTMGNFIKTTQLISIKINLSGDISMLKPGMNARVTIKNRH